jgi:hypothetical protein
MSYGLEIRRNDGTKILSQTMPGGRCFVQDLVLPTQTSGTTSTYTFSNVPGGENLRLYTMRAGMHTWTTGTNLSGQATLNVTAYGTFPNIASRLAVFTTKTTESFSNNIGLSIVNDNGERTASALYPCGEFLGKVTLQSSPDSTDTTTDGYNHYVHTTTSTSLGSGRTRLILWNLPSNSDDTWYAGDAYVSSSTTGSYNITMEVATKAGSYTLPEGFVFGLDNLSPSTDTYGLRIYDASNKLTFDAGLDHMVISAIEQGLSYNTSSSSSFSLSSFGSGIPGFFLPPYYSEKWVADPNPLNISSTVTIKKGFIKRNGSNFITQVITMSVTTEDSRKNITWSWGVISGLITVVVDSTIYGGTSL